MSYYDEILADSPAVYVPMQENVKLSNRGHDYASDSGRGFYSPISGTTDVGTNWGRILVGKPTPYGFFCVEPDPVITTNAVTVTENLGWAASTDYTFEILCMISDNSQASVDRALWWAGNNTDACIGLVWAADSHNLEVMHMSASVPVVTVPGFFLGLEPNIWMHLAIRWNQSVLQVLINGVVVVTASTSAWTSLANTDIAVGAYDPWNAGGSWPGRFSHFAVYNSRLSDARITARLTALTDSSVVERHGLSSPSIVLTQADVFDGDVWDYELATPAITETYSTAAFYGSNSTRATSSPLVVTDPASTTGQMLIAVLTDRSPSVTLEPSDSGWTKVLDTGITPMDLGVKVYWRFSNSTTDPSSWTFTRTSINGSNTAVRGTVMAYGGIDSIDVDNIQYEYSVSQNRKSVFAPDVFLSSEDTLLVQVSHTIDSYGTFTAFDGFTTDATHATGGAPELDISSKEFTEAQVFEGATTQASTDNRSLVVSIPLSALTFEFSDVSILTELLEPLMTESGSVLTIEF